jgi:hypothetical protein
MTKYGARRAPVDLMKVCQSVRDLGAKSFVSLGQLILSFERRMVQHFSHFTKAPGENGPFRVTCLHLQDLGLPFAGVVEITLRPVHPLGVFPFANAGSFAYSRLLYKPVTG